MNILFVCTGNTCRSCMAEVIFNKISNIKESIAYSAGISVVHGSKISHNAASLIKTNFNLDISNRIAKQLVPGDLENNDLILTMTKYMEKLLKNVFPEQGDKIYSLNPLVGIEYDVSDPFGGSMEMYQNTFHSLKKSIELLINKLKEGSGN